MCEDPRDRKFIEIAFGWGPGHIWLHTTLEGSWPDYMILEVCWDGLWTLSFGLSQFHGHGSWLVCEVALKVHDYCIVRSRIGWRGQDRPSSLHTRSKDLKKLLWLRSLHRFLCGKLWVIFRGLPEFALGPPSRGKPDSNYGRPWQLNSWYGLCVRMNVIIGHKIWLGNNYASTLWGA